MSGIHAKVTNGYFTLNTAFLRDRCNYCIKCFVSQVGLSLRDSWISSLRINIRSALRDVGKGWFNIHETNWEVYQISKLKKFMESVKFIMQVALFHQFSPCILPIFFSLSPLIFSSSQTVLISPLPYLSLPPPSLSLSLSFSLIPLRINSQCLLSSSFWSISFLLSSSSAFFLVKIFFHPLVSALDKW